MRTTIIKRRHNSFQRARIAFASFDSLDSLVVLFFDGRLGDDRQGVDASRRHLCGQQGVDHLVALDEGQAVEAGGDDVQVEMALRGWGGCGCGGDEGGQWRMEGGRWRVAARVV